MAYYVHMYIHTCILSCQVVQDYVRYVNTTYDTSTRHVFFLWVVAPAVPCAPSFHASRQVRKENIVAWCVRESEKGKRAPAPADNVGCLKLRGVVDLKAAYDSAVSEATAAAAALSAAGDGGDREEEIPRSGVGWTRNANEMVDGSCDRT